MTNIAMMNIESGYQQARQFHSRVKRSLADADRAVEGKETKGEYTKHSQRESCENCRRLAIDDNQNFDVARDRAFSAILMSTGATFVMHGCCRLMVLGSFVLRALFASTYFAARRKNSIPRCVLQRCRAEFYSRVIVFQGCANWLVVDNARFDGEYFAVNVSQ